MYTSALKVRILIEKTIREAFDDWGFVEVRTPLFVRSPGMEPHIRPFQAIKYADPHASVSSASPVFLPTSPEFSLKKVLVAGHAAGLKKIYNLNSSFRDEPVSSTHLPEFSMLEWYRVEEKGTSAIEEIQNDVEELFRRIAAKLAEHPELVSEKWGTGKLSSPWPRRTVRALFKEFLGIDLVGATRSSLLKLCQEKMGAPHAASHDSFDDLYFRLWLSEIEPKLPQDHPFFVTHYLPSQAALAEKIKDQDGNLWANRFEVYANGLELANAFQELTDPVEQRERFRKDMELRKSEYGESFPETPVDEEFIQALEKGLPRSAGIALGVDRLIMLFSGARDVREVQWLLPYSPD